mmetsp:Transcript_5729/g.10506  ORF Transcript_5729/g.10506 Transcript_5729/m.10506 type:complete len:118 (-) Transcript_5729:186-539(-)
MSDPISRVDEVVLSLSASFSKSWIDITQESNNWDDFRSQPQIKSSARSQESNRNDEFRWRKLHIRVEPLELLSSSGASLAKKLLDNRLTGEVLDAFVLLTEHSVALRLPDLLLTLSL